MEFFTPAEINANYPMLSLPHRIFNWIGTGIYALLDFSEVWKTPFGRIIDME